MSTRALTLARRFEEVHIDVLELAWATGEEEWSYPCPVTGWPVGGVFRHIARAYLFEMHCIAAFVSGSPLPPEFTDWAILDRWNLQFTINRPKDETIALLQTLGPAAGTFIGAMSAAQLDCVRYFPLAASEFSGEDMVKHVLLAHPLPHLEDIRTALTRSSAIEHRGREMVTASEVKW